MELLCVFVPETSKTHLDQVTQKYTLKSLKRSKEGDIFHIIDVFVSILTSVAHFFFFVTVHDINI